MYTITKEFHFCAGHHLIGLPEGHPCAKPHGHNYLVKVELKSSVLNKHYFVQDYGELKPIKDWIDTKLDHQNLNEILTNQPSAENIAYYIYHEFKHKFPRLSAVEVSETPKTVARYEPKYDES